MEEKRPAPKVSVILASWNCAGDLRRCLGSLELSIGRENIEIILVDSGSRDESPQLDNEFPNINLLRLPRNFGVVKALNIGMKTATGDFFLFLQPEMEVRPETISVLTSRLEAASDATAVCPLTVSPGGQPLSRIRRLPDPDELYRAWKSGDFMDWREPDLESACVSVDYVQRSAIMVRGQFLRGMRFIDERFGNSWWDLDVCHQIRHAAKKILLLPDVTVVAHPAADYEAVLPPAVRALMSADRALCGAVFAGKHYGWFTGFKFRLAATFHAFFKAMASLAGFHEAGYQFSRFTNLFNGQKLDGSQRIL